LSVGRAHEHMTPQSVADIEQAIPFFAKVAYG
jgi:hypothetical protein